MIIGIDIRALGNKVKSGVEEYIENLLANMLPLDKSVKYKLFYSSWNGDIQDYDWLHLDNVEVYKRKIPNKLFFLTTRFLGWPKVDKLIGGVDAFFSPHFFLVSLSSSCRRITTFHDLSYIHFPEFFSWRKHIWHNFEMRPFWQSRFSDKIITVSGSTKNDLIRTYGIDEAKIEVIHSGISSDIRRPEPEELERFRNENRLPSKYILFLGKLEPRKNLSSIIRAFGELKERREFKDLHLVLVGSPGWLYKDIFKEIQSSKYNRQIIFKDHIKDGDRKYYYSLAEIFVYTSFFEGFGFPPLEAMACNTPVIVSNTSSLPETIGEGGLLVQPGNIDELRWVISQVLCDKDLKNVLIEFGNKKINNFNWKKTAEKTLSLISSK